MKWNLKVSGKIFHHWLYYCGKHLNLRHGDSYMSSHQDIYLKSLHPDASYKLGVIGLSLLWCFYIIFQSAVSSLKKSTVYSQNGMRMVPIWAPTGPHA